MLIPGKVSYGRSLEDSFFKFRLKYSTQKVPLSLSLFTHIFRPFDSKVFLSKHFDQKEMESRIREINQAQRWEPISLYYEATSEYKK